ncbi:hypothetical protein [Aquimarina algicola]|uniref:hypothetical protein n=1 Tax=Aquimarina algicola TaxID=2589995 RepID=UPI001CF37365|nr:hypothetical protein [Aquimarina algicola]
MKKKAKVKQEKKLSFKKLQISKLNNLYVIKGGSAIISDDGTGEGGISITG